jgi:nitroimidazol reductase NimA-like FMN-containing flavoprotein (pyridoxamine 5'-phosphate oxidase superfamily)
MRRKDKEIADPAALHIILADAKVARLAMIDDGFPYVVPLCFCYRDNSPFFHSARDGKKIEALRKNPSVCFEIDTLFDTVLSEESCGCTMKYQSVIGFGNALFLEDVEEKKAAFAMISRRYGHIALDFPEKRVMTTAVIRVDIQRMTGKASKIRIL